MKICRFLTDRQKPKNKLTSLAEVITPTWTQERSLWISLNNIKYNPGHVREENNMVDMLLQEEQKLSRVVETWMNQDESLHPLKMNHYRSQEMEPHPTTCLHSVQMKTRIQQLDTHRPAEVTASCDSGSDLGKQSIWRFLERFTVGLWTCSCLYVTRRDAVTCWFTTNTISLIFIFKSRWRDKVLSV